MMPGARARPSALTVCRAAPSRPPTATMRPPVTPRSPCTGAAPLPSKICASRMTRSSMALLHDDFLLDDIAPDPADEERTVGVQGFHFRCAGRGFERGLVVEPQLGDAVDLDVERRNV